MPGFRNANNRYGVYIGIITIVALCLRFYRLDFQSLWLDELFTMKESDPAVSWAQTLSSVLRIEYKSPLYYFLIKACFYVFGFTGFTARSFSVIAGTVSVYAIYLLGKELFTARAGIIAAALTCVNHFHICYSQEVRGYIFLFLLTVLSFLFFIRTLRTLAVKNAVLFGLFTLLTVHIHPFAILVIMSQALITAIYFFAINAGQSKIIYVKRFALAYGIILMGCLPMVNILSSAGKLSSFWVPVTTPGYFVDYFYEFFGNSDLLKPFLLVSMICFLANVFTSAKKEDDNYTGLAFGFVLIGVSLIVIFLGPYLYAILKIPAVVIRYLISALPLLLLLIAIGISSMDNKIVRAVVLAGFISISLIDLFIVKKYYHTVNKTQFRELAEYIQLNSDPTSVIINEKTAWHQSYYLEQFGVKADLKTIDKNTFIDSLARPGNQKKYRSFWLTGAHFEPKLTAEQVKTLEKNFALAKSKDFFDAWARLYEAIDSSLGFVHKLDYKQFGRNTALVDGDSAVAIWGDQAVLSGSFNLPGGHYSLKMLAKGTPYQKIYPNLDVFVNDSLLGSFFTSADLVLSPSFKFNLPKETPLVFKVRMNNDGNDWTIKEDRNAFIRSVYFLKN